MDGRLTDPYASVALLATGTSAQTKELAGALVPVVSAVSVSYTHLTLPTNSLV